jgi:hypothetical protein
MTDYTPVATALAQGADPAMLCATCPWDRNCVNPPSMTAADIEKQMDVAAAKDEAQMTAARVAGHAAPLPVATLMIAAIYAGKDTALQACPVLGIRLRSSDGRRIAETVRTAMQSWVES